MSYSANQIADYFLSRSAKDEEGEGISNLKLQKLLYYAQGFHLVLKGGPLFNERIVAWTHGPVVPDVYHRFKDAGDGEIPNAGMYPSSQIDNTTAALLEEVWQAYGQFSAWRLREMTHREPPWINTPQSGVISEQQLIAYFSTQIENVDSP